MLEFEWIASLGELVLWAEVLLAWIAIKYVTLWDPTNPEDPGRPTDGSRLGHHTARHAVRGLLFGLGVIVATGFNMPSVALGAFAGGMEGVFHITGNYFARRRMTAEWEILGTLTFVGGSGWIIGASHLELQNALITLPLGPGRLAVLCVGTSILLFAGRGGTHIVRGVLDKMGTVPRLGGGDGGANAVDTAEYNRGRVIGNLERILLVLTVALEAYQAMGLIIAAKGLIRIKQFEERDFAEYFLIGTLTSVIVAFVLGWILREVVTLLW